MEILSKILLALFQTLTALMFVHVIDQINGAPIGFWMVGLPIFVVAIDALWLRDDMPLLLAIPFSLFITFTVLIFVHCLDQINGAWHFHFMLGLPVFLISFETIDEE